MFEPEYFKSHRKSAQSEVLSKELREHELTDMTACLLPFFFSFFFFFLQLMGPRFELGNCRG